LAQRGIVYDGLETYFHFFADSVADVGRFRHIEEEPVCDAKEAHGVGLDGGEMPRRFLAPVQRIEFD